MPDKCDLSLKMGAEEANKALAELQLKLIRLQLKMRQQSVPAVIMYEGCDASGKGGSILRITEKLDPRGVLSGPSARLILSRNPTTTSGGSGPDFPLEANSLSLIVVGMAESW